MLSISRLVEAGTILLGLAEQPAPLPTPNRPKDSLATILHRRLSQFESLLYDDDWTTHALPPSLTLVTRNLTPAEGDLKRATAESAAFLLILIKSLANEETLSQPSTSTAKLVHIPLFGSRDVKVIATLAGVVGRWGIAARIADGILPSSLKEGQRSVGKSASRFSEIVDTPVSNDEEELRIAVKQVLDLVLLPAGERRDSGRGQLAALVLPQLLLPLLGALVQIGFSTATEIWARESLDSLFKSNTPATALASLLMLLSAASPSLPWLRPSLSNLLSGHLMRSGGVRALLVVVVGNEEDVGLNKLEMMGKLLGSKPAGMSSKSALETVVPQLLGIVQSASDASVSASPAGKSTQRSPPPPPVAITKAACFVLSQLVDKFSDEIESIVYPLLHSAFVPAKYAQSNEPTIDVDPEALDPVISSASELFRKLSFLSMILLHSPPSPNLLPFLLSPILPSLFSLSSYLVETKADSLMLEEVVVILETWGKAVPIADAIRGMVKVVEVVEQGDEFGSLAGEETERVFYWARSEEGSICIRERVGVPVGGSEDPLKLKLDPESVVRWLKEVARKDLSSGLFLRWLDEVQALRATDGFAAVKRSVMRLQLVLKMVDEFGSEILQEPTQIIAFVAHALDVGDSSGDTAVPPPIAKEPSTRGFGMADLKIVEDEEMIDNGGEDEPVIAGLGADEMVMTALTLLLAVLEIDETLSIATTPLLSLIFAKLDDLIASTSEIIPPLAREARLVLTLRKAATLVNNDTSRRSDDPLAASREKYQEALKLLQDPILPVRAQGLSILRQLVAGKEALLSTDTALLPAVLDIFVQAIEDEDSFLYLNAIQGLCAMVDVYGRRIAKRLLEIYLGGGKEVGEGEKGRKELDKRLRIAESLNQVVQRAGEAFAVFVDDVVPALLLVLRTSTLPSPLRSSAITILATAVDTAPIALLSYADLLAEACLTLLSLESRPLQPRRKSPAAVVVDDSDDSEDEEPAEAPKLDRHGKLKRPEETADPVAADSKHPSLRRAAVFFLGMLFRAVAELEADDMEANQQLSNYDSRTPLSNFSLTGDRRQAATSRLLVSGEQKRRAGIVLGYVRETDEDSLVRHQANEVLDILLQR